MTNENGEEQPSKHPENESGESNSPGVIRRRVAEAIVLALYFIFEIPDAWHESHGRALLQGTVGLCAVLLIEFPLKSWIALSASISVFAFLFYLYVGPNLPEDTDRLAYLIPSNRPTPHTFCDTTGEAPPLGTVAIIIGSNEFWTTLTREAPIITLDDKVIMSMGRSDKGLLFSVEMFDLTKKLVAKIQDNKAILIPERYSYKERSEDRSALTLYNEYDTEILHIDYLNPRAVLIRGVFTGPEGTTVAIDDNAIHELIESEDADNCWVNWHFGYSLTKHKWSF